MALLFESLTSNLLALLLIVAAIGYYYIKHIYSYWKRLGVESYAAKFPFGNFTEIFFQQKAFANLILDFYNKTREPFVGIFTGLRPTLFVRDPELIRAIFIKDFNSFHDRGFYIDEENDPLTGHLFLLCGEKWRNLRGKLSPTFTSGKLKAMFSTIVDCGEPLNKFVEKIAENEEVIEMRELLAQYMTNIIASVAFGIDIDCIGKADNQFRIVGRQIFNPSIKAAVIAAVGFMFPYLAKKLKLKTTPPEIEDFILSLVKQNMDLREKNNVTRKDFFQLLVQLRNTGDIQVDGLWDTKITNDETQKKLSINECAAQAFVFLAAGFETSSSTISYALYELAKNPEIMLRAQNEIDQVFKNYNGEWTFESLSDMKYIEWIIDETLRKWPPVPMLNRHCNREWPIPNTNITIQPGTEIVIPAYAIQYDEKYYPDPQKFDPERFAPENYAHKTFIDMPYMPFGDGPRNCIGMRLGKMQTKVGLVLLLRNYWFELTGNTTRPLVMSIKSFVLAPEGGINLKVKKRNNL